MDQFLIDAKACAVANKYPRRVFLAFSSQYVLARKRGIAWEFTIQEWWDWWQQDDRWKNRGRGHDKLVMARLGDEGPYNLTNIYCATGRQNAIDSGGIKRQIIALEAWRVRKTKMSAEPIRMHRLSFGMSQQQATWLRAEAASLGVTIGELLRRIIDRARRAA